MAKEIDLQNKFVIAYDTLLEGWGCLMEENENGVEVPSLFDSEDEAFIEIFDGNLSMLRSHQEDNMLEEYNEGVTPELVDEMRRVLETGDVSLMRKFMDEHPECDDSGEWVEPANTFLLNRKAIFTEQGLVITGNKIVVE